MTRQAFALFCDDVRTEDNGKKLFIGVYDEGLLVPLLPAKLSKLMVVTYVATPMEDPLQKLCLLVRRDGDVIVRMDVDKHSLDQAAATRKSDQAPSQIKINGIITLPNFSIEKESLIDVVVETERETITAGVLRLSCQPAELPAPPP